MGGPLDHAATSSAVSLTPRPGRWFHLRRGLSPCGRRPIMVIRNLLKERRLEPRRDPMLDFAVKDTWRIFRIMGEFVEGFETLSQIKGVAVFGSARSAPGSVDYEGAEEMGSHHARSSYVKSTDGGSGALDGWHRTTMR